MIVNGCDRVLDKPIIIVEGFDPLNSVNWVGLYNDFNYSSYLPGQYSASFISSMRAAGYDFVFVDFTKNTDFIENNAKVLEAVITKVNATKVGTNKSTVIGWSMGGLVARWCLKDMEDRSIDHKVGKYFSYDAPHQGANIPLGLQYIFKEMQFDMPWLTYVRDFKQLVEANESPAARQMLVTKAIYNALMNPVSYTLDPVRAKFAQNLISKGYPQTTTNYGISFGRGNNTISTKNAGNGAQFGSFVPGSKIFDGEIEALLINVYCQAFAVPENTTSYISKYRFSGLQVVKIFGLPVFPIAWNLRTRNFKYHGLYPYDDAPGGYEDTQSQFSDNFDNISIIDGQIGFGIADNENHYGHNFVPLASALDLKNQSYGSANEFQSASMFTNVDNSIINPGQLTGNTVSSTLSPFQYVLTYTSDCSTSGIGCQSLDKNASGTDAYQYSNWNQWHEGRVSNQANKFMMRKILNTTPTYVCPSLGFCDLSASITGPAVVCTNGTFQISSPYYLNGYNIQWSAVNGTFTVQSGQGTSQVIISRTGHGFDSIKAVITNACGQTITYVKSVDVGVPEAMSTPYIDCGCGDTPPMLLPYTSYPALAEYQAVWGTYVWELDPQWTPLNAISINPVTTNGYQLNVQTGGPQPTGVNLGVARQNECGTGTFTYLFTIVQDYEDGLRTGITITPNPATNTLIVSLSQLSKEKVLSKAAMTYKAAGKQPAEKLSSIKQIKIYDASGKLRNQRNFDRGLQQATMDVSSLSPGTYIVQVSDGRIHQTQKLIIQR